MLVEQQASERIGHAAASATHRGRARAYVAGVVTFVLSSAVVAAVATMAFKRYETAAANAAASHIAMAHAGLATLVDAVDAHNRTVAAATAEAGDALDTRARLFDRFRRARVVATELFLVRDGVAVISTAGPEAVIPPELIARLTTRDDASSRRVVHGPVRHSGRPSLMVATPGSPGEWIVATVDTSVLSGAWVRRNLPRDSSVVVFDADATRGFEVPERELEREPLAAGAKGAPSTGRPALLRVIASDARPNAQTLLESPYGDVQGSIHLAWSAPDENGLRVAVALPRSTVVRTWMDAYALPLTGVLGLVLVLATSVTAMQLRRIADARQREASSRALARSEERLRLALASSGDGLWDWDLRDNEVFYSPRFAQLLRYEGTHFARDFDVTQALHPDDREAAIAALQRTIERREPLDHEFRLHRFDGSWGWFRARGRPQLGPSGVPLRLSGTITDQSGQKLIEQGLRAREALFRQAFEKSQAVQLMIDPHDGRIIDANGAACDFYRCSREALLAKSIADLNTLAPSVLREHLRAALAREAGHFEFRHRLADGEIRDVEVYSSPIETELGSPLLSIVHDVTRRRQAEEALLTALRRLRTHRDVLDRALITSIVDAQRTIRYANDGMCRISGYSREELIGRPCAAMADGATVEAIRAALEAGRVWRGVIEHRRKTGEPYWLDTTIVPETDPEGRPFRFTTISIDVSDRIAVERHARIVEARYDALFSHNPNPTGVFESKTLRILAANDALAVTSGHARVDLAESAFDQLIDPTDVPALRAAVARASQSDGARTIGVWSLRRRDGSRLEADVDIHPIEFDGVEACLFSARPVTPERLAELAIGREQALGGLIHRMQSRFLLAGDARAEFASMLGDSLAFTESTLGCIAQVLSGPDGVLRLRVVAADADPAHDVARAVAAHCAESEFPIAECDAVFGAAVERKAPVFGVRADPAGGLAPLPADLSPIHAYFAAPLSVGDSVVGVLGLANRAGGYDEAWIERMQPLFATFANLLAALRSEEARRRSEQNARRVTERLDLATGIAGIGVFEWELATDVIIANDRFCDIFGVSRDSLLNPTASPSARLLDMALEEDQPALVDTMRAFSKKTTRRVSHSYRIRKPGGEVRTVNSVWTVEDESHLVGVVVDVTDELRLKGEHQARVAAEAANRAKTEFLSRISHELRTPLSAILGFAQLLELDPKSPLSAPQGVHVRNIQAAGWHLLGMIDDILDLSRIEAGTLSISAESVHVESLLSEAVAMVGQTAAARGIRIVDATHLQPDARVFADRKRLLQVMLNLLSNAIKYNRENGMIRIGRIADNGRIRIWVSDSGIGMHRGQLDRLFTPFDRLGAESTDVDGAGIGLVVARGLLDQMNGRIEVESEAGSGTTFAIDLPAAVGVPVVVRASPGIGIGSRAD